ncbi:hypothetical protein K2X33_02465 [bacterium]|nr:hypothetical protein [bacterium]
MLFKNLALGFLLALNAYAAGPQLVLTLPVETKLRVPQGVADTLETWVEMFNSAKDSHSSIDIEQFYISDAAGEPMEEVLDAIKAAAGRGVPVRLIVDKTFLKNQPEGATALTNIENIEVRIIDYTKLGGGVQHSKYFIVGGTDAYLGSANFDWRALKHIHETGIRTQDKHVVSSLQAIFEKDWDRAARTGTVQLAALGSSPKISKAGSLHFAASPVADLPSSVTSTVDTLLSLIAGAKQSIQLQTMEYTTSVYGKQTRWTELQAALLKAAERLNKPGESAKVQVLLDKTKETQPGVKELVAGGVEVRAVEIPQYSGGPIPYARLIHSKFLIVDGKTFWLGTDNYGRSYYYGSRGVGVVSSDKKAVPQLESIFDDLWTSTYAKKL